MHIQPIQPILPKRTIQLALCLLVMFFSTQEVFSQDYYYDPPGSIANVNNWWSNPDDTGTHPTNFTSDNQIFNIIDTDTLNATWSVSGSGTKIIIGDGSGNITFTIPENTAYTGTAPIDVTNNATLVITNNTVPTLGTLHSNSTVIYNENVPDPGNQVIASATYGNLTIQQESPIKELQSDITVEGLLTFNNSARFTVTSASTLTLNGNLIISGTVTFENTLKTNLDITHTGSSVQIITASSGTGTIPCHNFSSTKTGGSLSLAASPATTLDIGNNFTIDYSATAAFNDNGNTVNVGGTFSLGNDVDKNIPAGTYQNISLDFTSGNNAILQGNVTVNGTLDLNGSGDFANIYVQLGAHNLTVNGGINSISGASSSNYIMTTGSGTLIRPTVRFSGIVFPVGTSTSYTPCTLIRNSITAVNFAIRTFDGVLSNGTSGGQVAEIDDVVNRTWVIDPTTSPTLDINLALQWNGSDEGATFDRSMVRVFKYDTDWQQILEDIPADLGSDQFDIFIQNISSFSEFSIGDAGSTLPVTWLSFTGEEVHPGGIASLEWKTASELNNEGFEVQKSLDGKNFEALGFVEGAGTTNETQTYGFADEHLRQNTYYRLKQIDFDGQFDYSRIIFVESSRHIAHPFTVYPNPVDNNTPIRLVYQLAEQGKEQSLQLQLHDVRGSLLLTVNGTLEELNEVLSARMSHLSQGMYLLTLTDFATLTHLKVLKQ